MNKYKENKSETPIPEIKGVPVNDDMKLEEEADKIGKQTRDSE